MLELYIKTGCPYCQKVIDFAGREHITLTLRNIADPEILKELLRRGGKQQVPFLVDEQRHVSLYESDDIITYIQKQYNWMG